MNKKPYLKYRFTRRAIERLMGESRANITYHIKRLKNIGLIESTMCDRAMFMRVENGRKVHRRLQTYDMRALKIISCSFNSIRAESVYNRCRDIMEWSKKGDFLNYKYIYID